MKSTVFKKTLALIISVVMMLSIFPLNVFTSAVSDNLPVMEAYNAASSGDYHKYYNKVVSVTFLDSIDFDVINASETIASWDVSSSKDSSVMAWMRLNDNETSAAGADRYDVYIAGSGGIKANPDSSYIFYCFSALKSINGFDNFHTDNVTTFYRIFEKCSSLESVDLSSMNTASVKDLGYMFSDCSKLTSVNFSGWNTENVTSMRYMFNNCVNIPMLDLSSFDTKNVANMERLFYRCENLTTVYISDKWNTDSVTNSTAMFNCCYLIEGLIKYDAYGLNDKTYADTDHYLTDESEKPQPEIKKYKVTYIFEGFVPDEIMIYPEEEFDEGTLVTLKPDFSSEGYEFSGWTSDDADIQNGEFVINNDVVIVGSWSKLYNVIYKYEGYVPEGAPTPAAYEKKAGDAVTVDPLPFVDGYVFSGWSTEDVVTTDGKFTMPEKDVTLVGSFRKPVESVEINGESFTVNSGDEIELQITVKPEDATVKDLIYTSSDESVATVDKDGKITTVGEGTAFITVISKDDPSITDTVIVNVKLPVTEIKIAEDTFDLYTDEKEKIEATVNEDATNKELTYISSDENVVIVDENGNITAKGEGTATITVISKDNPEITETITVNVKNPVTEITATEDFTVNINEEKNLEAKVNDNATNKNLIYESDNPDVAKVDTNGNVIAVGEGTAKITITSEDNPSVSETVTVTVKIPVTEITASEDFVLNIEDKKNVDAKVNDDATNKKLTYESENTEVAEVDEFGSVTAKGEGTTTITITSEDNPDIKETVIVTVKIPVNSIEIKNDDINLPINESEKLIIEINPENATDNTLIFKSENEDIASVDENGNITANGEGTTTITVISKDNPDATDEITVTVKIPVENVEITDEEIELEIGDTEELSTKITPDNATDKELIYETSDENVAKIDNNGKITATGVGTAYITVYSNDDPTKSDTIKISVTAPEEPSTEPEEPSTEPEEPSTEPEEPSTEPEEPSTEPEEPSTEPEEPSTEPEKPSTEPEEPSSEPEEPSSEPEEPSSEPEEPSTEPEEPSVPENPDYTINIPERIVVIIGQDKNAGISVSPSDKDIKITYASGDESIFTVDADGNIKGITAGKADLIITLPDGSVKLVPVFITAIPDIPTTHHICFGKTDGIGWYEVSVNGGDFKPQGPNSTLEVPEGAIIVVRVQDMWINDDFTFYVNGKKVQKDADDCITLTVDGYMLIGALSMDMEVPDVEESVSLIQKIINFIKALFNWIFGNK